MDTRVTSAYEKVLKRTMTILAGVETPISMSMEFKSVHFDIQSPKTLHITPEDIFGFPPGRERVNWLVTGGTKIKAEDLGPIGKCIYHRMTAQADASSGVTAGASINDPYAFAFMRDYFLLCQKQRNGAPPEEVKADLEKIVEKYELNQPKPKVNLTDSKAIKLYKKQPLDLANFVDAFADVFNSYFRETTFENLAIHDERRNVILSRRYVQADIFKACLEQGIINFKELKQEEEKNNPEKNRRRQTGEQYVAELDIQIKNLTKFKDVKVTKKSPGHTSSVSLDKLVTASPLHLPGRRISMVQQTPSPEQGSVTRPSTPPPIELEQTPSPEHKSIERSVTPPLFSLGHSETPQAPERTSSRPAAKMGMGVLALLSRNRILTPTPTPTPTIDTRRQTTAQPQEMGRSSSGRSLIDIERQSVSFEDRKPIETQIDSMIACMKKTKQNLEEILTRSLYETATITDTGKAAATQALGDAVVECVMRHITAYIDLTKDIEALGMHSGLDPKTMAQLKDLASHVVGSSRTHMDFQGCTITLPVIRDEFDGRNSVRAVIKVDDIFRRIPEKVSQNNPLGLSPIGEYIRDLTKKQDRSQEEVLPNFDFLYDLYQVQLKQRQGGHKTEEDLEIVVKKYGLEKRPTINVNSESIKKCVAVRPLLLSNFTEAFKEQCNASLNLKNYTGVGKSVNEIETDLLQLFTEQGLMESFRDQLKNAALRQYPGIKSVFQEVEAYQNDLKSQWEEFQKIYDKYKNKPKHIGRSIYKVMSDGLLRKIVQIKEYLEEESHRLDSQLLISIYHASKTTVTAPAGAAEDKTAAVAPALPGFSLESHISDFRERYNTTREELKVFTSDDDKKIVIKLEAIMSKMGILTGAMSEDQLNKETAAYHRKSRRGH